MHAWPARTNSSRSSGKNTRYLTLDTSPLTLSSCAWRRLQLYVLWLLVQELEIQWNTDANAQVLWGPLSYIVAWFIVIEHPLRYSLQALVCIGQLYGLVLYYSTSMFDHYHKNITYCRPEAYYFWFYYFFMNFIWMVIPGCEWTILEVYRPTQ